jgi:hypothetical protein
MGSKIDAAMRVNTTLNTMENKMQNAVLRMILLRIFSALEAGIVR